MKNFEKNQVLKLLRQLESRRLLSEVSGLRPVNYFNRKHFSFIFWDLPRDLCVYLRLETWTHLWKCRTRKPKEEVKTPKSSQTYKNFTSHFKPKTDACLKLAWIRNISTFKFSAYQCYWCKYTADYENLIKTISVLLEYWERSHNLVSQWPSLPFCGNECVLP